MALSFGIIPEGGVMSLSRYGDFVANGRRTDISSWVDGAQLEFRFFPPGAATITWPATITDEGFASFFVDKALVAELLDTGVEEWRLFYIEGTLDAHVGKGPIRDVS